MLRGFIVIPVIPLLYRRAGTASQLGCRSFIDKPQQLFAVGIGAWRMRIVALGERRLHRVGLARLGRNTHVCFERAIIGTVNVTRSGGGFGESRTPATSTCGSSISTSPWSGNRDAKCASDPRRTSRCQALARCPTARQAPAGIRGSGRQHGIRLFWGSGRDLIRVTSVSRHFVDVSSRHEAILDKLAEPSLARLLARCGRHHRPQRNAHRPTTRAHGANRRHRPTGFHPSP